MGPNNLITTTTNQYLAPEWVDQVLRDNYFFGKILGKVKRWKGSQMLFPKSSIMIAQRNKIFMGK